MLSSSGYMVAIDISATSCYIMHMKTTPFRISKTTLTEVRKIAETNHRTIAAQIEVMLRSVLDTQGGK